jgi:hypothetical protein
MASKSLPRETRRFCLLHARTYEIMLCLRLRHGACPVTRCDRGRGLTPSVPRNKSSQQ